MTDPVEIRAQAIYEEMEYDLPTGTKPAWVPNGNSLKQDEARKKARSEFAPLEAAGLRIVSEAATDEMLRAGHNEEHRREHGMFGEGHSLVPIWKAMHAKAPTYGDGK